MTDRPALVTRFFCIACQKWTDHTVSALNLSDYFAPIDVTCDACGWTRTADGMKREAIMAKFGEDN